jgi:hypothetical protein
VLNDGGGGGGWCSADFLGVTEADEVEVFTFLNACSDFICPLPIIV